MLATITTVALELVFVTIAIVVATVVIGMVVIAPVIIRIVIMAMVMTVIMIMHEYIHSITRYGGKEVKIESCLIFTLMEV